MKPKPQPKVPSELVDLSERIGSFIEYWGFKKIHGQIWTHIFLAHEPLDSTTLAKRLNVSKALISLAIKDLLKYEVIQVVGKGSRRKIFFQSNPDLAMVIIRVLKMRERKMLSQIMESFENLKKMKNTDQDFIAINMEKTSELESMIEIAESSLDALITANLHLKS